MIKLIIKGRPATKKNSQRICLAKNSRRFILQSKRYLEYEENALWQLKSQYKGEPITGEISVKLHYYLKDKRLPDLQPWAGNLWYFGKGKDNWEW